MSLSELSLRRPVTVVMLTVSMLVLGYISLGRLPLEQFPSISSSGITAQVSYPSSSPEEIERSITLPLEGVLGSLNNIDRISSSSGRNGASVRVDFKPGTDMDLANMEMREKVDQARALMPADVDRVSLRRWQSDQRPIVYASVAWNGPGDRLLDIVDKVIEPRLLRLNGVANITIDGLEEKQLIVELDQETMQSHNVSLAALGGQLNANNVNLPAGRVTEGGQRYLVRTLGEFGRVEEIGRLPLRQGSLRLEDIGRVNYGYPEKTSYERLNGSATVEVEIYKSSTANVVDVAAGVRGELEKIRAEYGTDLDIVIVRDRAKSIMSEVDSLINSAVLGAFLAVAIIFVFLRNIRSTLVVGVAIPTAALCVFTGLYVARELFASTITLNMVSMMGLMLAVGMLVDPAVVALESIFRRREEGETAFDAALNGSREIGMAVLASSLTTMCVFVPFFFLSDSRAATWLRDAGMTICIAVGVSMVVAITLIPLATSKLFGDGIERFDRWIKAAVLVALGGLAYWKLEPLGWVGLGTWVVDWFGLVGTSFAAMEWTTWAGLAATALLLAPLLWRFKRHGMRTSYVDFLNWSLNHRLVTLVFALALGGGGIYLFQQIEQRGMPRTPERRVDISAEIDRSYSLEEIDSTFKEIEARILAQKEDLDVEYLSSRVRSRRSRIRVGLVGADDGKLSTAEAGKAIMDLMPKKVGFTFKMGRRRSWSGNQLGVEVQISGRDPAVLAVLVDEVKAKMEQLPGVEDVDSSLESGEEEIRVEVDREQAVSYGLSPRQVARTIATALGTRRSSSFKDAEREIDIVLQLEEEDRANLEQLKNSRFEGTDGTPIQLAAVADFRLQKGPEDLRREDRQLKVTIFANTENRRVAGQLTGKVRQMMAGMSLPPGYSWDLGRASRWMEQDSSDNNFTMIFAVLLIYLIMASLFESLVHPFTILLAIPFSLIGVSLGLYATGTTLDNNGMLGLLILFGIVVNNGIVMVDHINQYRREGMPRREAVLQGGRNRLRPILMTAFTTILNLMPLVLPMLYGTAEGFSRQWGPIGLIVVSGLMSSTILTLVLAPTLYSLLDDLALWIKRVAREARGLKPAAAPLTQ
jgi:hydrophobic/amphiphilic exporter-1 (mainly G- bacteria), HAE1 family